MKGKFTKNNRKIMDGLSAFLEYNVVVRIPPKRSYTIQMKVESTEKGKPIIVEP